MSEGSINLFKGPMTAGKTTRLIEELREHEDPVAIKPEIDDRYSDQKIETHDGRTIPAHTTEKDISVPEIEFILEGRDVLGVDEAQFYDVRLVKTLESVRDQGVQVYVSSLNRDYTGSKWRVTEELEKISDCVETVYARCGSCGGEALYTQKLRGSTDQVDVGGSEKYEPRCEKHHAGKPV